MLVPDYIVEFKWILMCYTDFMISGESKGVKMKRKEKWILPVLLVLTMFLLVSCGSKSNDVDIKVYLTSSTTNGAIGDMVTATSFCSSDPNQPSGAQNYSAFLSYGTSVTELKNSLPIIVGKVYGKDGITLLGNTWEDFITGFSSFSLSQRDSIRAGASETDELFHTGFKNDGSADTDNCWDWTLSAVSFSPPYARKGRVFNAGNQGLSTHTNQCDNFAALLCITW